MNEELYKQYYTNRIERANVLKDNAKDLREQARKLMQMAKIEIGLANMWKERNT